jgi:segregation and condensation protein A
VRDAGAPAEERVSERGTERPWEDPPRAAAPTDAPILSAEGIEGPLDWLLEMARAQKLDLAKLPIGALIQSFAEVMEVALSQLDRRASTLARWGDWLVMAATLTQLRSRLLLPAEAPEAKAALSEAEAWRQKLIAKEEMLAAADWLERRPQLGSAFFARGRPESRTVSRGADITDLLHACLALLRVPDDVVATYRPRPPVFWRVSQAIARIEEVLVAAPGEKSFQAFLPAVALEEAGREGRCRAAVASTLVAGLELAREGKVLVRQQEAWGEISVSLARSR